MALILTHPIHPLSPSPLHMFSLHTLLPSLFLFHLSSSIALLPPASTPSRCVVYGGRRKSSGCKDHYRSVPSPPTPHSSCFPPSLPPSLPLPQAPLTASDVINDWPESEIARILRDYGEERQWRQLARRIVEERGKGGRIETTGQLARVLGAGGWEASIWNDAS